MVGAQPGAYRLHIMLILLLAGLALGARTDTVRVEGGGTFLVSPGGIVRVAGDSVVARLPWSAPPGLAPVAACEGPDRGIVVLDAARGGRIVHLGPRLRVVSSHPLPEGVRSADLAGARLSWDRGRGLVVAFRRPPRRWLLGFLAGPPVELPPTDSVLPP